MRSGLEQLRGKLKASAASRATHRALAVRLGNRLAAYNSLFDKPTQNVWIRGDTAGARRAVDSIVALPLFDSLPPGQRNYPQIVLLYAMAGSAQRARAMFEAWDRLPRAGQPNVNTRRTMLGYVAAAERRYDDAIREFRATIDGRCQCIICDYVGIGFTYDLANNADSTIAILSRYTDGVERPLGTDAYFLAPALRRLGELHDARGDVQKALSYYARFVELWKDADPDLQPHVRKVRARLAELQRRQG